MRTDLITIDRYVGPARTLGSVPLFAGSRVPLANLFDYLNSGTKTVQDFCEDYPTVDPQQLRDFLLLAKKTFSDPATIQQINA